MPCYLSGIGTPWESRMHYKAVELIRPELVIPMHYGSFPAISVNPWDFKQDCPVKVEIFKPGEDKIL